MNIVIIDDEANKKTKLKEYFLSIDSELGWNAFSTFPERSEDIPDVMKEADFILVDSKINKIEFNEFGNLLKLKNNILVTGGTASEIKEWIKNSQYLIGAIQTSGADAQLKQFIQDSYKKMKEILDGNYRGNLPFSFISESITSKIHSLGHKIKNPFLSLDLSLQKFIQDINSSVWKNAVCADINYALDSIGIVQQSIADLLSEISDINLLNKGLNIPISKDSEENGKIFQEMVSDLKQLLIDANANVDMEKAKKIQTSERNLINKVDIIVQAADRNLNA